MLAPSQKRLKIRLRLILRSCGVQDVSPLDGRDLEETASEDSAEGVTNAEGETLSCCFITHHTKGHLSCEIDSFVDDAHLRKLLVICLVLVSPTLFTNLRYGARHYFLCILE